MTFLKNNKGKQLGGIIGLLLAFIFNRYWYHIFPQPISLLIIVFLMVIGAPLGGYIYKKRKTEK